MHDLRSCSSDFPQELQDFLKPLRFLRAQPMKINEKQKQTHPVMKRSLLWQL